MRRLLVIMLVRRISRRRQKRREGKREGRILVDDLVKENRWMGGLFGWEFLMENSEMCPPCTFGPTVP